MLKVYKQLNVSWVIKRNGSADTDFWSQNKLETVWFFPLLRSMQISRYCLHFSRATEPATTGEKKRRKRERIERRKRQAFYRLRVTVKLSSQKKMGRCVSKWADLWGFLSATTTGPRWVASDQYWRPFPGSVSLYHPPPHDASRSKSATGKQWQS